MTLKKLVLKTFFFFEKVSKLVANFSLKKTKKFSHIVLKNLNIKIENKKQKQYQVAL